MLNAPTVVKTNDEGSGTEASTQRLSTMLASTELTVQPSGRSNTGPSLAKLTVWLNMLFAKAAIPGWAPF